MASSLAEEESQDETVSGGGLSGKPLEARSTQMVRYLYDRVGPQMPIIGLGGVDSAQSAYRKIRAGVGMLDGVLSLISSAGNAYNDHYYGRTTALTPAMRAERGFAADEEWDEPMISGIHWVSELIEAAGGIGLQQQLAPERAEYPQRQLHGIRPPAFVGMLAAGQQRHLHPADATEYELAGVALHGDFEEVGYDDFHWVMDVDFWGVVQGTKEFLPHLIESGDGHIVNLSSLFGLLAMPGQSAYNATKFAVRGFTEAVREEMLIAGHKVGVTSVHPGGIKTAIARSARVSDKEDKAATAKLFDEKLAKMTPERAAEIIVKGITKNQARVLVGLDAHALHTFQKFTGSRYEDIIAVVSKKVLPAKAV